MNSTPAAAINSYYIVLPDAQAAGRLEQLIKTPAVSASVQVVPGLMEFYGLLPALTEPAVVLIDLFWDGHNAAEILLGLSAGYPHLAFLIVSDSDLSTALPPQFPIPHAPAAADAQQLAAALAPLTEDLRGSQLGAYQLQNFAGQDYLGRVYAAHQAAMNRAVWLTVLPADAAADRHAEFTRLAAARAQNQLPQIYAIYETGADRERQFLAQEPPAGHSLLQFSQQQVTFDSRLLAAILATAAKALAHLHEKQIPHEPLRSSHLTVSPEGVIRLANTALPAGAPMPDPGAELQTLADIIQLFVSPQSPADPRLTQVLRQIALGQLSFSAAAAAAEQINLTLAPVQHVAERQSAVIAKQEVDKAKKSSLKVMYLSAGSIALLLTVVIIQVILMFIEVPGRDFSQQIKIPAGEVTFTLNKEKKTAQLAEFYIDQYEVTIGQYEKFLKAMAEEKKQDPEAYKKYVPPGHTMYRDNFEPHDWASIRKTLRKGLIQPTYGGNRVTRDTPVFNVDYIDAYAYAKWAGKRLPTELEWQRAAAGNDNWIYPWGEDYQKDYKPDLAVCNAYPELVKVKKSKYPGPQIVDQHNTDKSPFGVIGMAGNVSEWVALSPELGPLGDKLKDKLPMKGANYSSPQLIPNSYNRQPPMMLFDDTMQIGLGFRCASDQPVKEKKK